MKEADRILVKSKKFTSKRFEFLWHKFESINVKFKQKVRNSEGFEFPTHGFKSTSPELHFKF